MKRTVSAGVLPLPPDGRSGSALSTLTSPSREAASRPEPIAAVGAGLCCSRVGMGSGGTLLCAEHGIGRRQGDASTVQIQPGKQAAYRGRVSRGWCGQREQRVYARRAAPDYSAASSCPRRSTPESKVVCCWQHPCALVSVLHRESAPQARCYGACSALCISARCHFLSPGRKAPATASLQPDRQRRFPYVS